MKEHKLQEYLFEQMGKERRPDGMPAEKMKGKGPQMSVQELKLNKALLKEISQNKKEHSTIADPYVERTPPKGNRYDE